MPTVLLLSLTFVWGCIATDFEFKHHSNIELEEVLNKIHRKCEQITRVYTLDKKSVKEVPLYVIEFSSKPGQHQPGIPEFNYVANIHGNEVLGRELLLKLADYLCVQHRAGDPDIIKLISTTRIHLLPSINPDGWQIATDAKLAGNHADVQDDTGRNNAKDCDLEGDFPFLTRLLFGTEALGGLGKNHLSGIASYMTIYVELETEAMMNWIREVPFVLSANFHGGHLVSAYPYCESQEIKKDKEYSATPDDLLFRHLASAYASHHADMANPAVSKCGDDFPANGIINAAAWTISSGGLQDYYYLASNDYDIHIELGCEKYPAADKLELEWTRNKEALLYFMWQVHLGVKGFVMAADTEKPIEDAFIHVKNVTGGHIYNINHNVRSAKDGDYYRLLTDGEYEITAGINGYKQQTHRVIVSNKHQQEAQRLDFKLQPDQD